jgi:hypothetical protein
MSKDADQGSAPRSTIAHAAEEEAGEDWGGAERKGARQTSERRSAAEGTTERWAFLRGETGRTSSRREGRSEVAWPPNGKGKRSLSKAKPVAISSAVVASGAGSVIHYTRLYVTHAARRSVRLGWVGYTCEILQTRGASSGRQRRGRQVAPGPCAHGGARGEAIGIGASLRSLALA